jgi:hypothetical protein
MVNEKIPRKVKKSDKKIDKAQRKGTVVKKGTKKK